MSTSSHHSGRRRWWLQFSLRGVLLLVLLAGVVLGAWRAWVLPFDRQRVALDALQEQKSTIITVVGGPAWLHRWRGKEHYHEAIHVGLDEADFRDEWMPHLLELRRLQSLVVHGKSCDDSHLKQLAWLGALQLLVLDGTSVSEAAAAQVQTARPELVIRFSQATAIENSSAYVVGGSTARPRTPSLIFSVKRSRPLAVSEIVGKRIDARHFDDVVSVRTAPDMLDDGVFSILAPCPTIQSIDLSNARVTGRGIGALAPATKLRKLDLSGCRRLDTDSFDELRQLPGLEELVLSNTRTNDDALQLLQAAPNLRRLVLDRTLISGEGVEHLARIKTLEALVLERTALGDDDLAPLAELTGLDALDLSGLELHGAGLRHLSGLKNLRVLDLRNTRIDDSSLAHLSPLTALETLHLSGAPVTDQGLAHLRGLKNLQQLDLTATRVSIEGASTLSASLPGAKVLY